MQACALKHHIVVVPQLIRVSPGTDDRLMKQKEMREKMVVASHACMHAWDGSSSISLYPKGERASPNSTRSVAGRKR
jgi:hypothetical protein